MANDDYVKVEDRVRVVERGSGLFALQVLHGRDAEDSDNWHGVLLEWCETSLEPEAAIFRDAMRLACEDVRERCAKHVADRACEKPHCVEPSCCGLRELAAAIRELEL